MMRRFLAAVLIVFAAMAAPVWAQTYSAQRNQIMTWAGVVIDPRLTTPRTLTNAVAHELGHSFGLLDCYSCKQGSTVMIQFKTVNVSNGMNGPKRQDHR